MFHAGRPLAAHMGNHDGHFGEGRAAGSVAVSGRMRPRFAYQPSPPRPSPSVGNCIRLRILGPFASGNARSVSLSSPESTGSVACNLRPTGRTQATGMVASQPGPPPSLRRSQLGRGRRAIVKQPGSQPSSETISARSTPVAAACLGEASVAIDAMQQGLLLGLSALVCQGPSRTPPPASARKREVPPRIAPAAISAAMPSPA